MRSRRRFLAILVVLALGTATRGTAADPADAEPGDTAGEGTSFSAVCAAMAKWFYEDVCLVTYGWGRDSWRRSVAEDRLVPGRLERLAAAKPELPVAYPYQPEDREWVAPRELGEGTLPYARFDFVGQYDSRTRYLLHSRVELGFGPFAADYQQSRVEARDQEFEFDRLQALLRLSFSEAVEVDLGAGFVFYDVDYWHRGPLLTLPVLIHPNEYFGLEFRPTVGDLAGDNFEEYDVSLYFSYRLTAMRLGYRWLYAVDDKFRGPEFGLTLRF